MFQISALLLTVDLLRVFISGNLFIALKIIRSIWHLFKSAIYILLSIDYLVNLFLLYRNLFFDLVLLTSLEHRTLPYKF